MLSVHTPETPGERSIPGVRRFVHSWNIQFPVLTDNSEQTWDAYGVTYWPSEVLIDKKGRIRYIYDGELNYDGSGEYKTVQSPDRKTAKGTGMNGFTVERQEMLTLDCTPPLAEMYTLSPFVWQDGGRWELLVRAVPRRDDMPALKISRVYYGRSEDGLRFTMGQEPVIAPGPGDEDRDGCEDPTLAIWEGTYYVYYSGWNEAAKEGQLLLAAGPDCEHLEKRGVMLPSTPEVANPKEVTIVHVADGTWRLFFEYAADGRLQDRPRLRPTRGRPVDRADAAVRGPAGPMGQLAPEYRADPDFRYAAPRHVLQRRDAGRPLAHRLGRLRRRLHARRRPLRGAADHAVHAEIRVH